MKYRLTPHAKSDLIEIRRFTLKQWSSQQSKQYTSGLKKAILLLSENPSLGKSRGDIGHGISSFPYKSHIIYYFLDDQNLIVFGILHKRMVPLNHLGVRYQ